MMYVIGREWVDGGKVYRRFLIIEKDYFDYTARMGRARRWKVRHSPAKWLAERPGLEEKGYRVIEVEER